MVNTGSPSGVETIKFDPGRFSKRISGLLREAGQIAVLQGL